MAQKKAADKPAPKAKATAKKTPAKPKANKERKFLEDFLLEIKKKPLTRREIINKVQQFLHKG